MNNWKEVTEVKLKSFYEPTLFGDKYIIGTARSVGHYYCYTVREGLKKYRGGAGGRWTEVTLLR